MEKIDKTQKPVKQKNFLQYKFTNEEINAMAKQLAYENNSLDQYRSQKKAVVSEFDNKIKVCEAAIMSYSGKISNGNEYRNVECDVYMNHPNSGIKTIERTDTGESWTESMSSAEMQEKLSFEESED